MLNDDGVYRTFAATMPVALNSKQDEKSSRRLGCALLCVMDAIQRHKIKLIEKLRLHPSWILQHVHSKGLITNREASIFKTISVPGGTDTF